MSAFTKRKAVALAAAAAIPFSLTVATPAFAATTTVATWAELKTAFDSAPLDAEGNAIKLGADITSENGERLLVPHDPDGEGAAIVLDLAGHSLAVTAQPGTEQAAVGVFDGASLVITDSVGGGELDATGARYAAGIGSDPTDEPDNGWPLGEVVIEGGTVTAIGGEYAAGIGNAWYSTGGLVEIRGGTVTAIGGASAAGIGAGVETGTEASGYDAAAEVDIQGGVVTATGGDYGAGIGGGYGGRFSSPVSIANATVTATGGAGGPGIGGSNEGVSAPVDIENSTVLATGTGGGAGIGGAYRTKSGAPITITGSTVTAIGSVFDSPGKGLFGAAGIGEGAVQNESDDTTVLIKDSTVDAVGAVGAAGIGTGSTDFGVMEQQKTRSLQGVAVLQSRVGATGGDAAAGIGGAQGQPGTQVQIGHDSHVVATGGSSEGAGGGAGIGAGASLTDSPAPTAGTLVLEGNAQLGSAKNAGTGAGIDRVEGLDARGGAAADVTADGEGTSYVFNVASTSGAQPGAGGATDISWVAAVTPSGTTPSGKTQAGKLPETGSDALAPGLTIGGLLMAAGAALVLRRRVRAKA